ncbi:MAG: hypothetical protein R2712_06550 [Vicinamibacterales bacterium]
MKNIREKFATGSPIDRSPPAASLVRTGRCSAACAVDVEAAGDGAVEQERLGEGELVVLRARPDLQRDGERLAAAEEVGGLEGQLPEEPLELRHARAEGELVAVLLLELERDVDLALLTGGLLDVNGFAALLLDVLEVPELVQAPDAELEGLRVEGAPLVEAHLAADDVVARGRVAGEGDAVDQILVSLGQPHRHVDGRLGRARDGPFRGLLEGQVGIAGELEVAAGAVEIPGLDEPLANALLAVPVAGLQLVEGAQELRPDDIVAVEREVPHLVARALVDGDVELHPAGVLVGAVLEHLQLGLAHPCLHVATVPVELHQLVGIFLELGFLVLAPARDPGEEPVLLGGVHLALELAVADFGVALEVDRADLDLRPFLDVEDDLDQLRAAGQGLDRRVDLGELVPLLGHQALDDALDAPDHALVEEGVEAERDAELLHLLVHLGALHLVGAGVVHDLDPRPLLHVVHDPLADHAVTVGVVVHLDPEVVEEAGAPEALEVLEQRLLGVIRIGHPHPVGRPAGLGLDVVEVGLGLDEGLVDRVEPQLERADDRCRAVGGLADRGRRLSGRCLDTRPRGCGGRRLRGRGHDAEGPEGENH